MSNKIEILEMIAKDMENDARNFDGQPFNGKTVAEYFGNQGAAIAALANIMKSILDDDKYKKMLNVFGECNEKIDQSGNPW